MIVAATVAVSVGIGACVVFGYIAVRSELLANMDAQLARQAASLAGAIEYENSHPKPSRTEGKSGSNNPAAERAYELAYGHRFGDAVGISQFVFADGKTIPAQSPTVVSQGQSATTIPIIPDDRLVAAGVSADGYRTIQLNGGAARVYTMHIIGTQEAVMVALPLSGIASELKQLGVELALGAVVGIILAAALGWWVTRTALRPVAQLTEAAERIAREPRELRELAHRIDIGKRADKDEVGRLAISFNAMLAAVQDATKKQRQLVADASHELRTPLTSLRMNAEVLDKFDRLDDVDRKRVINSLLSGIDELTGLVADTMELARGEEPEAAITDVRWDELTRRVVDRASRHWPQVEFRMNLEPCTIRGVTDRLERAVGNLVNNAAKFSGGVGHVELDLDREGTLTVRDHGPGIPEEDLPHVFNRFYRSAEMRDRPGSGLGLAIVAQVAESHGGSITATNAFPGSGALFTMRIPSV